MSLPSISDIESGASILFLGAGFSAEATNVVDEKIKDVSGLITYLLSEIGIHSTEGYDLDSAAEDYQTSIGSQGEEKLARALHTNFRSKIVTEEQRLIVCQPWYRIYTSNYDDVVERVCTEEAKPYTTKEITDVVNPPMPNTTQLIHIYGNITRSSESEFRSTFLLTERQRDDSVFIKSPWMRRFHDDVLTASSVVFVGFSLTDIDLRRLLGSLPQEVLRKIHFVVKPDEKRPIVNRLNKYGTAHTIGLKELATHLKQKRAGIPVRQHLGLPVLLEEIFFTRKLIASVSSRDIEDLMISGEMDLEKFAQSDISGEASSYTIARSMQAYSRISRLASGERPILVHSDIGNGKTIFAHQVCYHFSQQNYRVFKVRREPENIGEILSFLQSIDGSVLVMFDDVMRFTNLPTAIINMKRKDIIVLATVRSIVLDTNSERVASRLGFAKPIEVDLNFPVREVNLRVVTYLTVNGLLGKDASLSEKEKLDFVEKKCGSQIRDVVLSLYNRGSLHTRVEELLQTIQSLDVEARNLIVFSALLSYADWEDASQFSTLSDLTGYSGVLEDFRETLAKNEISTLIRLDRGDVVIRSPALAQFILARVFNLEAILDIVGRALANLDRYYLDRYYTDDEYYVRLGKGLLKFSLYGRLIKGKSEGPIIEKFYDGCRTLSFAKNDPLFWVQRSICNMHNRQFPIAGRFVETAYSLAHKRYNFDTYQIDNHNARLMLTQSSVEGVSPDGEREQQAQALLRSVLNRKSDDLYHPLSVMRLYVDIVENWTDTLSPSQKSALRKSVNEAMASISKFRQAGRFRNLPELKKRLADSSRRLAV